MNIFERTGRHWALLFSTPIKWKVMGFAVLHPSKIEGMELCCSPPQ